ncbi:MAG TPA: hypothetical protein VI215_08430 [Bacteroidota bacterium]
MKLFFAKAGSFSMAYRNKYLRIPILLCLLFGSAQPSANFLACTVTIHRFARTVGRMVDCCKEARGCNARNTLCSTKSSPAQRPLPCCHSVVPFTSVSEQLRIGVPQPLQPVTLLPGCQSALLQPQLVEWKNVPPSPDVGVEILTLNLRI